jgi:putative oxidoreductase
MNSVVALIGRALMAAIFIESGLGKLIAPAATTGMMAHYGLPVPMAAYVIAVIVELAGGFAILIGFRTRGVAAVLAFWCIATALVAHADFGDRMQQINFLKNLCMAGGFLQLVAFGPGRYRVSDG